MSVQRRHGALSLIARLATLILVAAGFTMAATVTSAHAAPPVTNAVSTTTTIAYGSSPGDGPCLNGPQDQDSVNCNLYTAKEDVWLSGLPSDLAGGDYFLAVLAPGGQPDPNDGADGNLSRFDDRTARSFHANGDGTVSALVGSTHVFSNGKVQLYDYADTPNPGGVYILAVCALPSDDSPVTPSSCKYDAFKVGDGGSTGETPLPLQVSKDANGFYDTTYAWDIAKTADKTLVKQVGGSATFNYTVSVHHDAGTVDNVQVTGTITVFNPNSADVTGVDVTDVLSDGTVCDVPAGTGATVVPGDNYFQYGCDLTSRPQGQLDNTATAAWPEQAVGSVVLPADLDDFTFSDIQFTGTDIDDCVSVNDSFAGSLGTVCVGDANPTEFTYARTIPVPAYDCQSYDNTATFTTDDTGTTSSASQTVTVCGPARTGALTMGFWQNKNGQGIITGGAYTPTGSPSVKVCNSGTWLRQFKPFQDLSATATCAQVGTYVTTVIKAANASGAAMNAMLKGQMLATSLDVYFSSTALGGNKIGAPAPIGGQWIDLTKVCKNIATCTVYENTSAAFGGASSLTVGQLLSYAASQATTVGGTSWYGQVKATQELAKDTFDAINNQKAFAP
jgi:hypothetical protein